ncbi:GTPase-activating Rap/Ran-GAP domain-like protein 3 isoform X1 [Anastrepha obliqua]|uniref:GTPase-activating Rap/Ran-GAP domain-like protein 3 isoform X1 n=1 Tax=Anastrepha obliqua TaxID=95512 RepID=UPI00240A46AF|nr:GTPase-activating Rap/Ran-GAP domain-like protein 3 isoform X1 [Anastrepha obliqua]XP_054729664.1 GTPase-activating Rap/Ran-GAP domain-like protein 3 isoform X1 [Anastrepha obliqua]
MFAKMESLEKISHCTTSTEMPMATATGIGTLLTARTPTPTHTMSVSTSPHTPPSVTPKMPPFPSSSTTTMTTPLQPLVQTFTTPLHRKKGRLQRSERLQTVDNSSTNCSSASASNATTTPTSYSAWEALVKESFGQIAWPIKITSWELVDDRVKIVPNSSSATELISRRGVFSRHHYGSVDQLPQSDLDGLDPNFKRFRVENGDSLAEKDEVFGSPSTPILENPEHQTRWYFKYFLGKLHQNYVGIDAEKNQYFLSVVSQESGHQGAPMYRAILFRKQGTQKIALPYQANQKLTVKQILTHFTGMDASAKNPKEIFTADIQKDLLLLEEQEGSVNFKFGVVYMQPGQDCDDEMLSNQDASQDFEDFLHILGERIRLKGWDRFRGGLDVKGDMTGKYSVYTLYEGHEIMFHVSTLLPYSRDNRQQVERKRHIGNDIVNIIFIDQPTANKANTACAQMSADGVQTKGGSEVILPTAFDPTWIKSQFTHIFAVVTKIDHAYRLAVFCDENVPPFGPTLPNPPEFTDIAMFREFLLVKMINAEKATFQTPIFSQKRERTLDMLIKDLYEDYMGDSKLNMLNRRAFSEVLYDVPRTSKLKEDARQIEFVRIGQALKLEAIVRGDAPTSIASASPCTIFRKPPWEPHCFYPTFLHRGTLAGDSFGCNDDSLFIATDDGTFLMKEDQSHQLIFDKSFQVRQLSVLEDHGLVLIRGGSLTNRDAHRMHVFRLREFQPKYAEESLRCRSRAEVKERRIERTRGCHLYASSRISGGHLRLVVAVNRKLQLFQWKHTAAWTSWCPENDTETVEGFIFQKEITLCESPSIITPLEGPTNTNAGGLICVGYKYHYEIVCDQIGTATRLYDLEQAKRNQAQLTAAIELCDGMETELLLCYNHTCHFQKLSERDGTKNDFDFHWNTSPTAVVCAFPYILGFTSDSMEIRLLVNGNLVHTAMMPELQLITSKRDIFFVTTAPEFMSKDLHIKGLQINEFSASERRLVTTPSEASSNEELSQGELLCSTPKDVPINPEYELTNLLEIPNASMQLPHIHRARSLQKTYNVSEEKPVIAKSNSCGDTDNRFSGLRSSSIVADHLQQHIVPPNSPRNTNNNNSNNNTSSSSNSNSSKSSQQSPMSPTRRTSKYRNLFNSVGSSGGGGGGGNSPHFTDGCSSSPDRLKPLRVYRIPLAKLTGAHSHFHMHAFNATAAAGATPPIHPTQHLSALSMTKRQKSVDAHLSLSMSSNPGVGYHE